MAEVSSQVKVLSGNRAAAYGVLLCKPEVICAYPITPQTAVLEYLAQFVADGLLKAETVEVEGEHSAISVLTGAAAAGGRTFTATSSQGLAFMYEAYHRAASLRLPIVMAIATREMDNLVAAGQQDVIAARDAGWVQIHTASCQEILDTLIMAYRLAEDPEILLPVSVCYDGFYLSHLSERVEVPPQEEVDRFLPPREAGIFRLDPESPMRLGRMVPTGELFTEYRYKHALAMEQVKEKLEEIEADFFKVFGRSYGGQVEKYRLEDAEVALVAMGSCASTAKVVVDRKREEGLKVGLITVRLFRPFPKERLSQALQGKKAVGVIDRNVNFGWNSGTLFMELRSALYGEGNMRLLSFIDGLGGSDITLEHIGKAVDRCFKAARGEEYPQTTWLALE